MNPRTKNKTRMDANKVNGLFIYHERNRVIYSNIFMGNKGYIINSSEIGTYSIYSLRFISSLLLFLLLSYILKVKLIPSLLVSLGFYAITTLFFVFTFLKKLPVTTKFDKSRENIIEVYARKQKSSNVVLSMIACLCLCAFSVYAAKTAEIRSTAITNYIIVAFSIAYFALMLVVLIKKKNYR